MNVARSPPDQSDGSEELSERDEGRSSGFPEEIGETSESELEGRESEVSVNGMTRCEFLGRESFRALFYSRGCSSVEVMELLNLSSDQVGTLMRYHGVGGFKQSTVPDEGIIGLLGELSDEEWTRVVE